MKLMHLPAMTLALGFAAFPFSASAASYTTTSLNMRAGPSVNYVRIGVIPAGRTVRVYRCTRGGRWCRVSFRRHSGWVAAAYLATPARVTHRRLYKNRRSGLSIHYGRKPYYRTRYRYPFRQSFSGVSLYFRR